MEFKKIISIAIATLAVLSAASSCMKEQLELTYSKQDESIDRYVGTVLDTAKLGSVTYNNGSCRLTTLPGEGDFLQEHGTVSFYFAGYTFNGRFSKDELFCTNHEPTATEAGWSLNSEDLSVMTINLHDAQFVDGLKKGLVGVRAGEECQIIFSGKYGFGKKTFGIIPANSALLYKIWVKSISNE